MNTNLGSQPAKATLANLLPDVTPDDFIAHYWCQRPYVYHGNPDRLVTIGSLPMLSDVNALLRHGDLKIRIWFTDDSGINTAVTVNAEQASALYKSQQLTVVVDSIERRVPAIAELMKNLAGDLESPMVSTACNVYASPVGIGTRMHFDEQEVFLVQLRGAKRWHFAPVEQLRFPTKGYAGGDLHPELAMLTKTLPDSLPSTAEEVVLRPGSVLFLPRGTWHASKAIDSDSFALTLTFNSASWADIFLKNIRRWMIQDEEWRRPARGPSAGGQTIAQQRMSALSAHLSSELSSMRVAIPSGAEPPLPGHSHDLRPASPVDSATSSESASRLATP